MKTAKIVLLAGLTVACMYPTAGRAQHVHDGPGAAPGPVAQALTPEETHGYRTGHGMGLARVAELNLYPGPLHVLELADSLELTPAQREAAGEIRARMLARAVALGNEVLAREAALEERFRAGEAEEGAVRARLLELGRLQAELRFVHVRAHLEMKRHLTAEQVRAYHRLRGYE